MYFYDRCLGGFTEQLLTAFGMKDTPHPLSLMDDSDGENWHLNRLTYTPPVAPRRHSVVVAEMARQRVYEGVKGIWKRIDDEILKPNFGGSQDVATASGNVTRNMDDNRGNYELSVILDGSDSDDEELMDLPK